MRKIIKSALYAVVVVATVVLAGCSNSCTQLGGEKTVSTPEEDRPSYGGISVKRVVKRDLALGSGPEIQDGQTAVYEHTAWIYDPKKLTNRGVQIEGSGESATETKLGTGNIIKGFSDGMIGMKVGGKRQLIIPPELAYADKGMEPHVFPGAIILIDVELVQIK